MKKIKLKKIKQTNICTHCVLYTQTLPDRQTIIICLHDLDIHRAAISELINSESYPLISD